MTVKIYIDQWLMINAVMNVFLLFLLKRLTGLPAKGYRIILGGLAGALVSGAGLLAVLFGNQAAACAWNGSRISLMVFILSVRGISLFLGGILMIWTVWGKLTAAVFYRTVKGLFLLALLFGGLLLACLSFLPELTMSAGSLLCAGAGCCFLARAAVRYLAENREKRQKLYGATLYYRGKECRIIALWDTGNQLFDPFSKKPVHILDSREAKRIAETVSQVRYIPYQTIGQPNGTIAAIVLDRIQIETEKESIILEKPLVALSLHPVSPKGEYQLLLHGSAFERNQQTNLQGGYYDH